MSKQKVKPVDMELDPADRGRKRKAGRVGGAPPAQMAHASSPRAARHRRDGQRWLATEERLRADAVRFADEVQDLDEDGFVTRTLARIQEQEADRGDA